MITNEMLDRAVATFLNPGRSQKWITTYIGEGADRFAPTVNWIQAGHTIEREGMTIWRGEDGWFASIQPPACYTNITEVYATHGPTPLIAAMLCFVKSKRENN